MFSPFFVKFKYYIHIPVGCFCLQLLTRDLRLKWDLHTPGRRKLPSNQRHIFTPNCIFNESCQRRNFSLLSRGVCMTMVLINTLSEWTEKQAKQRVFFLNFEQTRKKKMIEKKSRKEAECNQYIVQRDREQWIFFIVSRELVYRSWYLNHGIRMQIKCAMHWLCKNVLLSLSFPWRLFYCSGCTSNAKILSSFSFLYFFPLSISIVSCLMYTITYTN